MGKSLIANDKKADAKAHFMNDLETINAIFWCHIHRGPNTEMTAVDSAA